jgi:hypothetical protein
VVVASERVDSLCFRAANGRAVTVAARSQKPDWEAEKRCNGEIRGDDEMQKEVNMKIDKSRGLI